MPSTPGPTRRQARERALELLYEAGAKGVQAPTVVDAQPTVPDAFAVDVANGVEEHRVEIPVYEWEDTAVMRVSIGPYNDESDVARLADAVRDTLAR